MLTDGDDEALRFWNVASGREMLVFTNVHHPFPFSAGHAPWLSVDGNTLLFTLLPGGPVSSNSLESRLRYRLIQLPTLAEIDAREASHRRSPR